MKRARLLMSVVMVIGTASLAQAKVVDLNGGNPLSTGSYSLFGYTAPNSTLSDFWNFTLGGVSDIAGTANPADLIFSFGSLSFDLLSLSDFSFLLQQNSGSGWTTISDHNTSPTSFIYSGIGAGTYRLAIAGTGTGIFGGGYLGNLQVAAVPELDTWLMLLIGAGLIAYQLRRKQSSLQQTLSA